MSMRCRVSSIVCLLTACSRTAPAPAPSPSSGAVAVPPASTPTIEFGETDFRGTFNGAKLVATFDVKSGAASGSCFYESVGADIPLRGKVSDDGSLVLNELDGDKAVSTITLRRGADGTLSGTWSKGDKSGPAALVPVTRKPAEPVVVVTRQETDKSLAICGWDGRRFGNGDTEKPSAPCIRRASVPVVFGLSDRPFQRSLNAALVAAAKMKAPDNPIGVGVVVSYAIAMNARGVLSIVLDGRFDCGPTNKDCELDAYLPGHNGGRSVGLTAAVDGASIARSPADFIDLAKARSTITPIIRSGFALCVTAGDEDPLQDVMGAVLADDGVRVEHDSCANHVHSDAWAIIPYAKVKPALKADSPFAPAWKP